MALIDKLLSLKDKWQELGKMIVDPSVIADNNRYAKLTKEYKDLEEIVEKYNEYREVLDNIKSSEEVLETEKDQEFRDMAKMELQEFKERKSALDDEIKFMLIPKDPDDGKNVLMEIRAGTGGDEASIFAGDLYRMYTRFLDNKNWRYEIVTVNDGTNGGYKEVAFNVFGADVYANLRFESGVHRVQRVPETESQGRVHTSAATVAVLPEPDEIDFQLNMADVKKDTYRSSGAGGQHVNKTESAVRLTHLPTNTVVECQEERSQIKNYEKALNTLRTKLYEAEVLKREEATAADRKSQISSGDRSAKIRTYNFPQGRVTDHRINLTLYNLNNIMNGDLDEIIAALKMQNNIEKLNQGIDAA